MRKGLSPVAEKSEPCRGEEQKGKQSPQHQKFAMSEIQYIAHPENQGEAKGGQGIDPSLQNSGNNQLDRYFH
jgi:hypothetical protein